MSNSTEKFGIKRLINFIRDYLLILLFLLLVGIIVLLLSGRMDSILALSPQWLSITITVVGALFLVLTLGFVISVLVILRKKANKKVEGI